MNTNGDSTNQQGGSVTSTLADPNQQAGSTAQAGSVSTQQASSNPDMFRPFEDRISRLMSEKDKKDNELRQSIAAQVELQKQLTALQEQSQAALTSSAQTTQSAIDQANQLSAKIVQLEAMNTRNRVLQENPDLIPYADLIPASQNVDEVKAVVDKLRKINEAQLARLASTQQQASPAIQPLQTNNILESLYGNKPGMATSLNTTPLGVIPPSAPAQMAPMASAEDQNKAIEQILVEARKSGDPEKFAAAMEEAKHRAEMLVKGVAGGS